VEIDKSKCLVADKFIASFTSMSQSWVRKQRMYRRRGLAHVLNIDPVMIGSAPRYRLDEFDAWLIAHHAQAKGR
jgi:hypothetical protein